jgi:hypothetical protein
MLTLIVIDMVGRPKNPNRPPTVTAVRITERTQKKLIKLHRRWGSNEPYNNTIERAIDEVEQLRKKVDGLEVQIQDQQLEIETKAQAYLKLFTVKENFRQRLDLLEKQRAQLVMKKAMK